MFNLHCLYLLSTAQMLYALVYTCNYDEIPVYDVLDLNLTPLATCYLPAMCLNYPWTIKGNDQNLTQTKHCLGHFLCLLHFKDERKFHEGGCKDILV